MSEASRLPAPLERIGWHELSGLEARDVAREVLARLDGNQP